MAETAKTTARDYNADFDAYERWADYYPVLKKELGLDDSIRGKLRGTRWDDPVNAENAYKFIHPGRTPENSVTTSSASQPYGINPNKSPYNQPLSIMDAYYANKFGDRDSDEAKRNRNYFLADQFGTFARNLGKDIGNVGAQFTGGTIDNNRDTSQWDARNNEVIKEATSADVKNINASDAAMNAADKNVGIQSRLKGLVSQDLENNLNTLKQVPANMWKDLINNADENSPAGVIQKALGTVMLDNSVNGRKVDIPTILATLGATSTNKLEEAAAKEGKDVTEFVVDYLKSSMEDIKTSLKGLNENGINVNLNTGNSTNNLSTNPGNPYAVIRKGITGRSKEDHYDTMANMQNNGFLKGTPYEGKDFSDAYAYAKKHDGYTGSKDHNFTNWLYARYKDKVATYDAPGSNN